ncbi:hypothetical protein ACJ72_08537 [Emergomyces africanus]|uniref:Uncharacterized protein n=1 Tax=Emergomyces africanus TaxID=1955775 RepID=A0A1B7NKM0_9EURO|nr:hypothetical protein ACJ72_08537 [Emergomyces africanus]
MASLQSSSAQNNNNNNNNGHIDINTPQNHGPHSSTSASLTTDEPTRPRARSRPTADLNSNLHYDLVAGTEEPADRHRHTAGKTVIGNNRQSYQDATELVDLPPLRPPPLDHSGEVDGDNDDNNGANRSKPASISTTSSGSVRLVVQRTTSTQQTGSGAASSGSNKNKGILVGVKRFWSRHISMTVPRSQNRDHFGCLGGALRLENQPLVVLEIRKIGQPTLVESTPFIIKKKQHNFPSHPCYF